MVLYLLNFCRLDSQFESHLKPVLLWHDRRLLLRKHESKHALAEPRIAVAGLNPHCGENGLFGQEEINEINPAVETAKAESQAPAF
jgi:4-hydroxy-L-threonine phosphate dehydrogenase PdxA